VDSDVDRKGRIRTARNRKAIRAVQNGWNPVVPREAGFVDWKEVKAVSS
jgi:hypothetical protein